MSETSDKDRIRLLTILFFGPIVALLCLILCDFFLLGGFEKYSTKGITSMVYTYPSNMPEDSPIYTAVVEVLGMQEIQDDVFFLILSQHYMPENKTFDVTAALDNLTIMHTKESYWQEYEIVQDIWKQRKPQEQIYLLGVENKEPIPYKQQNVRRFVDMELFNNGCVIIKFTDVDKPSGKMYLNSVCNLQCGCNYTQKVVGVEYKGIKQDIIDSFKLLFSPSSSTMSFSPSR